MGVSPSMLRQEILDPIWLESDLQFRYPEPVYPFRAAREMSDGHAGLYWEGRPMFARS
jgi:hypothetical protein